MTDRFVLGPGRGVRAASSNASPETAGTPSTRPRRVFVPCAGLFGLLALGVVGPVFGASDDFLREIENEAKRQAATLITTSSSASPTDAAPSLDPKEDRMEAGLDPAAFEQALRGNLPGSYILYQQLDANRKQQVHQAYQKDNRLTAISEQITRLLGGKP